MVGTLLGDWLTVLILSVTRLACALRFCPPFSESILTGPARHVVVILLALPILPTVLTHQPHLQSPVVVLAFVTKEVVIGCCIGFLAAIPFRVIEIVGNLIDNQRGATMGEVLSPMSGAQEAPLASFLMEVAMAFFYISGAVLLFLKTFYWSITLFPVTQGVAMTALLPGELLGSVDGLMRLAVVLAAPVVLIMVLATLGLGLVNRSAPQLNVFFLSMPVKSALGIWVLLLGLRFLLEQMAATPMEAWLQPLVQWFRLVE